MQRVNPDELVGSTLTGVTAAWYRDPDGRVDRSAPVHVWMRLEPHGSVRVHGPGDGSLELSLAEPYAGFAMDDHSHPAAHDARWLRKRVRTVCELAGIALSAGAVGVSL